MEFGHSLLMIIFVVIQIYIQASQGFKIKAKGIMNTFGVNQVTSLLNNFIIPIYAAMEISKLTSIANLKILYVIPLMTFISLSIRIVTQVLVAWILRVNKKTSIAYSLIVAFPALGPYTLVISNALCMTGNPLYGDALCNNILGSMMLIFLIFALILFSFGMATMNSNKLTHVKLSDKLKSTYYLFIKQFNIKDEIVLYLFETYIKDTSTRDKMIQEFFNNNSLSIDEFYNYSHIKNKQPYIDVISNSNEIKKDNIDEIHRFSREIINDRQNNSLWDNEKYALKMQFCDDSSITIGYSNESFKRAAKKRKNLKETIPVPKSFNYKSVVKSNGYKPLNNKDDNNNQIKDNNKSNNNLNVAKKNKVEDTIDNNKANGFKGMEFSKKEILSYYMEVFNTIESHLQANLKNLSNNDNTTLFNSFKTEKQSLLSIVKDNEIPEFKVLESTYIGEKEEVELNRLYNDYALEMEKSNLKFQVGKATKLGFKDILKKLFNPVVIGCFIGIMIGLSDIRTVLHSTNHYIKNITNCINFAEKAFVPLLFINLGYMLANNSKSTNRNMSLTKAQIILSFIFNYGVFPAFGLLVIYIMTIAAPSTHIINTSLVFKFAIYLPWCLPVAPVSLLLCTNNGNFYMNEFSFLIFYQIATSILFQSFTLIIFFIAYHQ